MKEIALLRNKPQDLIRRAGLLTVRLWITAGLLAGVCAVPLAAQSNVSFQYFYDDDGHLSRVVDSAGNVVTYAYDAAGNMISVSRSTLSSAGALAAFNIIPHQGVEGSTVIIQGQGFSTTPGNDTVKFNGVPATVTAANATQLTVTVPTGATTGSVSVTVGGVTAQGPVFTVLPHLVSISVTPANPSLPLGDTLQFAAKGTFSDGTSQDLTSSVTWSSSNNTVANISNLLVNPGLATPVTVSSSPITIMASLGSVSGSTLLTVLPPALLSIAVFPQSISISVGQTLNFKAIGTYSDNSMQDLTTQVTWGSTMPGIATISNTSGSQGQALGRAPGPTSITAFLGSLNAPPATLTVNAVVTVPRFLFSGGPLQIQSYAMDNTSGRLHFTSYNVFRTAGSGNATSMVMDSTGKYMFATDDGLGGFNEFTVDQSSGKLSNQQQISFNGLCATQLILHPSGKFLYALCPNYFGNVFGSSGEIFGFSVDSSGTATQLPGFPVLFGPDPSTQALAMDPAGNFLYATDDGASSSTLSVYAINSTTGALTVVPGSPFSYTSTNGFQLTSVNVVPDPTDHFVYVCATGGIYGFSLNQTTGVLTPISGSPFSVSGAGGPSPLVIEPTARFAYEVSGPFIFGYNINPATGALTALAGSPFSAPGIASPGLSGQVVVDPSGQFLYFASAASQAGGIETQGAITTFSLNLSTGALVPVGIEDSSLVYSMAFAVGANPVTLTPQFAYVTNSGDNTISAYSINAATGALTAAGTPFPAGGAAVASIAADALGRFVFSVNQGSGNVSAATINQTNGTLTPAMGSPFAAGTNPVSAATEPTGQFLYVVNNGSNNFSEYSIDPSSGALSPLSGFGSPCSSPSGVTNPTSIAVEPLGRFAYVVNAGTNTLSMFTSNNSGCLFGVALNTAPATGNSPSSIAVHPSGLLLFVANRLSNNVSVFVNKAIFQNTIVPVSGSPFAAGTSPSAIVAEPSGQYVYVANSGSNNVSAYSVNPANGALTQITGSPFSTGTSPSALSLDISGKFLYVTNAGSNNVSVFTINLATGALTPVSGSPFPAGTSPSSLSLTGKLN